MAGLGGTPKVPSLPPPRPKSPPEYPDLYGKRRELAKIQMLEREIGYLEDELKFVEGLQPASKSCKEVADFVTTNSDPLMPVTKRVHKTCCFWTWLCGSSCFSFSWICCQECIPRIEMPRCCDCNLRDCISCPSCPSCLSCPSCPSCPSCTCIRCSKPKCHCCSCLDSQCFRKPSCSLSCHLPKCPSCSNCFCNGCTSCYPKCLKVNLCSCCTNDCCYNCYICY